MAIANLMSDSVSVRCQLASTGVLTGVPTDVLVDVPTGRGPPGPVPHQ
jgi:hypothetical protein